MGGPGALDGHGASGQGLAHVAGAAMEAEDPANGVEEENLLS